MESNPTEPIHFLNLEYFMRLLYEAVFGSGKIGSLGLGGIHDFFLTIWSILTAFSYVLSLAALLLLVFTTVRMMQIREEEEHDIATLTPDEAERKTDSSRWAHILSLIESPQESDWRQAIVEADIMLEEVLIEHKYQGETTGERLERADPHTFKTLANAKEAHEVKNEMMHYGPSYPLTEHVAYRAIKNYEAVLVEFDEIAASARHQSHGSHH